MYSFHKFKFRLTQLSFECPSDWCTKDSKADTAEDELDDEVNESDIGSILGDLATEQGEGKPLDMGVDDTSME